MSNFNINDVVYVDSVHGNDESGQLNNFSKKCKTLDGAYQKICALGPSRPPFKMALSSGDYIADEIYYENIAIESYNDLDGILPNILIPTHEQSWNGVICSDVKLSIDVTNEDVRNPIFIVGPSLIKNSVNIEINQFTVAANNISKKNKIGTDQLPPEGIKSIFVSETIFKQAAPLAIRTALIPLFTIFEANDILIVGLEDPQNSIAVSKFITALVRELASVLFQGIDPGVPSPFYYLTDFIMTLFVSDENNIKRNSELTMDEQKIRMIMDNVNIQLIGTGKVNTGTNFIYEEATVEQLYQSRGIKLIERESRIKKHNIIADNQVASMVRDQILNQYFTSVEKVLLFLEPSTSLPKFSIINSNITSSIDGKDTPINLTDDIYEYIISNEKLLTGIKIRDTKDINSNNNALTGIKIRDTEDINNVYPIIKTGDQQGSTISRSSKFTRYRDINDLSTKDINNVSNIININNIYTHTRLDGEIFFIDACNNNKIVYIPIVDQFWKGRILEYKRTDKSDNKVLIININTTQIYELDNYLRLIIDENGKSHEL